MIKYIYLAAAFCSFLFADTLSLSDAYYMALNNDPATKAAYYKAKAQDGVIWQARSKLLPQLNINYTGGKQTYSYIYNQLVSNQPYGQWGFVLTQPIIHLADSTALSVEYLRKDGALNEYKRQEQKLSYDVAKAYFGYIKAENDLENAKTQESYYQKSFERATKMLKTGHIDKMTLMQADIDCKMAQADLITKQGQVETSRYALEKLIGQSIKNKKLLDTQTINYKALKPEKKDWEDKLANNADVQIAKSSYDVANRNIKTRYAEITPTVDFQLSSYTTNTTNPYAMTNNQSGFVVISMPISFGGYNYGRISEAKAQAYSAANAYEASLRDAKLSFEDAWSKREYAIKRADLLKQALKVAELTVEATEKQYAVGLKSIIDVYDSKKKYFDRTKDFLDATNDLVNSELNLLYLTGLLNLESLKELEKKMYFE